jgi:apolipoprotein N-acyltransferase
MWVSLAPLLVAAVRVRPWAAAGLGLVWTFAMGACVAFWLPGMLTGYFGAPTGVAWLSSLALFLFLGGTYFAAFASGVSWLAQRGPVPAPIVGCAWAGCEFARANLLVANPWALSAYSQVDSALAQTADFSGPWGLAFLIGAVNAIVAGFFEPRLRARRQTLALAGVLAVLLPAFAYGYWRLATLEPTEPGLRVSIVQGAAVRPYDHDGADSRELLERHLALTERVIDEEPDVVLWPEGAVDFQPGAATQRSLRLLRFSRKHRVEMIVGGRRQAAAGQHFNSMFQIRRGRLVGVYDKRELMPFSETNPLRGIVAIGTDRYAPGDPLELLEIDGQSLGTLICSEAMRPGAAGRLAQAGATLILNPSNDYWFGSENAARLQLTAGRFRAIESRRPVIRVTSTGYSALIGGAGRVAAHTRYGEADLLTGTVAGSRMVAPYSVVGDTAAWLSILTLLAWIARSRRRGVPASVQSNVTPEVTGEE